MLGNAVCQNRTKFDLARPKAVVKNLSSLILSKGGYQNSDKQSQMRPKRVPHFATSGTGPDRPRSESLLASPGEPRWPIAGHRQRNFAQLRIVG